MKQRSRTLALALIPFVLLLVLGWTVKVPYVSLGPGPTFNTLGEYGGTPIVEIDGAPTDQTSGNLNMTTVSATDGLTLFAAVGKWFSSRNELVPRTDIYPSNQTRQQTDQQNAVDFSDSENSAESAALTYLKYPTGPGVVAVQSGGPSDGKLRSGDLIVAVDGTKIAALADVGKTVSARRPGAIVTVSVRRDGADVAIPIVLGKNPDAATKAMLGISVGAVPTNTKLKITFHLEGIGGPSAGMMFALAIIDKLSSGQLNGGKFIAGTGEITADGQVGVIGGITHKMLAAREAGATVFLVPAGNCTEAKTNVPSGLNLVKVSTLSGAVSALHDITSGQKPPAC